MKLSSSHSAKKEKAYIFVDHSNIFWAGVGPNFQHRYPQSFTLDLVRMAELIESPLHHRSAEIVTRFVGGSTPSVDSSLDSSLSAKTDSREWQWEQAGYKVHTLPRSGAHGGREVGVDEMLHAKISHQILQANLDEKKGKKDPSTGQGSNTAHTLVLLTGDGNDNSGRTTFPDTVRMALEYGWRVELWSWKHSLSRAFKELARQHPCTRTGGPGLVLKFLDGSHSWLCHLA
jgi:hypothetical protein